MVISLILYTDFQKAFDSVPHKCLLSKIKSYGIEGNMLNWINTFLNNGKQCVLILQSDINKVDKWTWLWILKLNPDKCKCMTLSINKIANKRKYFFKYTSWCK